MIHLLVEKKGSRSLTYQLHFSKAEGTERTEVARGRIVVVCASRQKDGYLKSAHLPPAIASQIQEAPPHLLAPSRTRNSAEFRAERHPFMTELMQNTTHSQSHAWLYFALLTVGCWGLYGAFLHNGQVAMGDPINGRYKAFLCVGIAYFLTAVLAPLGWLLLKGASWSSRPEEWAGR